MLGVINLAILVTSLLPATVQDAQVQKIQERYEAARPNEKSLGFYSLDWAMNLEEAKARAKKESRPILLILNANITAGTNFFSGHT
jgi:hypothetical protein